MPGPDWYTMVVEEGSFPPKHDKLLLQHVGNRGQLRHESMVNWRLLEIVAGWSSMGSIELETLRNPSFDFVA